MVDLDIFDRLLQFRPAGAPVLSVYVAVDGGPSALRTKLESLVVDVLERRRPSRARPCAGHCCPTSRARRR